jgi:hypothetical protein
LFSLIRRIHAFAQSLFEFAVAREGVLGMETRRTLVVEAASLHQRLRAFLRLLTRDAPTEIFESSKAATVSLLAALGKDF